MYGFEIGDIVIADKALDDTFPNPWRVVGMERNLLGRPLIVVAYLDGRMGTVFYPEELSHVSE